MKLRLKGNSLRLRLTQSEVTRLRNEGSVEEAADFGGGTVLAYRVQRVEALDGVVRPEFRDGTVSVIISANTARKWTDSEEIGIYAQAGPLSVSIEKDFRCLTLADDEQDFDAYAHPAQQY